MTRYARAFWAAIVAGLFLLAAHLSEAQNPEGAQTATVPAEYQDLYTELDGDMKAFDAGISSHWDGKKYPVTYAAELITANGNRGEALLNPRALNGSIALLDRFQELGIRGVVFAVPYPLLSASFPRRSEYLEFFKNVAAEVRKRDMKLCIETGYVFPPPYSKLDVSYAGLTFEQSKAHKRQMVETIIAEVKPDYLVMTSEPSTVAHLTKLREYKDPERVAEMIRYVLDGLDRKGVLLGAGAGTWDSAEYIRAIAERTTVDFIDIHVYPVNRNYLQKASEFADIARAHKMKVTMAEAWLYKTRDRELSTGGIATTVPIFGRDTFSFFAPLDQKFLTAIAKLANCKQMDLVSPFWVRYFFSYLDYGDKTRGLDGPALIREADKAASRNIVSGTFSATGLKYKEIIASGP